MPIISEADKKAVAEVVKAMDTAEVWIFVAARRETWMPHWKQALNMLCVKLQPATTKWKPMAISEDERFG